MVAAWYWVFLALAVGFGLPVAVLSAALGQGRVGAAAMESIARQPEAAGEIRTSMILALAFIESLVIYALVMFFMLQGKIPTVTVVQEILSAAVGGGGH